MLENIIIPDKRKLELIKKKISDDGKGNFHVIADFDRTLTKAFVDGQKSPTVIAQIRNGNYLTLDYAPKAHALYDIYHPIEIDSSISFDKKNAKMQKWWEKHFKLLFECGLDKEIMHKIVKTKTLQFREGALEFLDLLHESNIPLIIMSAGPGDMISMYLEQEGRLYDNIHIIANFFKFGKNGKVIGLKGKIIHSLNKHETEIKGMPFYNKLKKRENILLLGDSIEDLGMVEGFDYKNLIKIGFYNYSEDSIEKFRTNFDVIILNDSNMGYVNELAKEILSK